MLPLSSSSLGVLLEERGDPASAELAYRQADALGHAGAALNLGVLHEARGELERRRRATGAPRSGATRTAPSTWGRCWRSAVTWPAPSARTGSRIRPGHAPAAGRLAAVLAAGGDVDGARAARRRAQERGDVAGAKPSPEARPAANGAARWPARRRAVLVLATSAAVVVGTLGRALHPEPRRDGSVAHPRRWPTTRGSRHSRRRARGEFRALGQAQHLTPRRRDLQGEAGARPGPRVASSADARSGQGACGATDACLQSAHHPLDSGHHPLDRPRPLVSEHRLGLDGHLGADRHAHRAGHADATPTHAAPPPVPRPTQPRRGDSSEWRRIGERGCQWRRPAQQRLVG